ncbi:hypothetical protein L1987_00395 [Smallanthus sonchifolius]|uniref:Uncharacterized protein n=1 Tax=Smallanthus sonchifolius TaxID=185202 RepID=A0ACB9K237_9ASTR|nr:hypothetical protein L1987_00395 [Smallanthus sonchifolius]
MLFIRNTISLLKPYSLSPFLLGFLIHPKFLQSLSLRAPSSSNSGIDCSARRLIFGSNWWFEQFEATILGIC